MILQAEGTLPAWTNRQQQLAAEMERCAGRWLQAAHQRSDIAKANAASAAEAGERAAAAATAAATNAAAAATAAAGGAAAAAGGLVSPSKARANAVAATDEYPVTLALPAGLGDQRLVGLACHSHEQLAKMRPTLLTKDTGNGGVRSPWAVCGGFCLAPYGSVLWLQPHNKSLLAGAPRLLRGNTKEAAAARIAAMKQITLAADAIRQGNMPPAAPVRTGPASDRAAQHQHITAQEQYLIAQQGWWQQFAFTPATPAEYHSRVQQAISRLLHVPPPPAEAAADEAAEGNEGLQPGDLDLLFDDMMGGAAGVTAAAVTAEALGLQYKTSMAAAAAEADGLASSSSAAAAAAATAARVRVAGQGSPADAGAGTVPQLGGNSMVGGRGGGRGRGSSYGGGRTNSSKAAGQTAAAAAAADDKAAADKAAADKEATDKAAADKAAAEKAAADKAASKARKEQRRQQQLLLHSQELSGKNGAPMVTGEQTTKHPTTASTWHNTLA